MPTPDRWEPLEVYTEPGGRVEIIQRATYQRRPEGLIIDDPHAEEVLRLPKGPPLHPDDLATSSLRQQAAHLLGGARVIDLVRRDRREAEQPDDREGAIARKVALWWARLSFAKAPTEHSLGVLRAAVEAIQEAVRRRHLGRIAGLRVWVESAMDTAYKAAERDRSDLDPEEERDAWMRSAALGSAWADVLDDSTPERMGALREAVQAVLAAPGAQETP